jgi:signal transduction histidine kinase
VRRPGRREGAAGNARLVERLRASLPRLRESNRLKDDFVAAVSHELRSPLTAIQGSLSTLLRDDVELDAATARSLLETADRQSRRLHRLVEDLLVVTMLEAGVQRPRLGDVHLSVLLGQVLEDLGADGRHLVETDVPAGLGPVRGDADRLHQILANLIGNARKYAPAGTTITVRVRPGPTSVDVLVADQGPGVPSEARERIFERFYQVDQSRTRRAGGVGLGLYLCRRLAASIGAEVVLERSGPHGSVFAVRGLVVASAGGGGEQGEHQLAQAGPEPRAHLEDLGVAGRGAAGAVHVGDRRDRGDA